jgi:hypothetical protein
MQFCLFLSFIRNLVVVILLGENGISTEWQNAEQNYKKNKTKASIKSKEGNSG